MRDDDDILLTFTGDHDPDKAAGEWDGPNDPTKPRQDPVERDDEKGDEKGNADE